MVVVGDFADMVFGELPRLVTNVGPLVAIPIGAGAIALVLSVVVGALRNR